jgi:hypothetical protein
MYFDQLIIPHGQEAVPLEIVGDVVIDLILVQVMAFNQQLRIKLEFQHISLPSFPRASRGE